MRIDTASDVERARRPDNVVASPYEGTRKGSTVIMKMPNPKPVTRCTKLPKMLRRKMDITVCIICLRKAHEARCVMALIL